MNNNQNEQLELFFKEYIKNIPWDQINSKTTNQFTEEYGDKAIFSYSQSRYIHLLIQNACIEVIGSYHSWLLNHLNDLKP